MDRTGNNRDYQQEVRSCAISAVHAAIARAMEGEWRQSAWESYIEFDEREPRDVDADRLRGKFRRHWMPRAETLALIDAKLPEANTAFWNSLPLWALLDSERCDFSAVDLALQSLVGGKRSPVWVSSADGPSANHFERTHTRGMEINVAIAEAFSGDSIERALQISEPLEDES